MRSTVSKGEAVARALMVRDGCVAASMPHHRRDGLNDAGMADGAV
ncbi:MAG TPA: hypothetical protein VEJ16_12895 [Alphaproteobacteria bacterium]|nr:hypothetical protein [Alphaproteobacteria bacterium]